jgi:ubiquitin-like protein Pup
MAKREQVVKQPAPQKKEEAQVEPVKDESAEKLKAEMDAMLDEIDSVLEENAQEFVNSYIQKGGE